MKLASTLNRATLIGHAEKGLRALTHYAALKGLTVQAPLGISMICLPPPSAFIHIVLYASPVVAAINITLSNCSAF